MQIFDQKVVSKEVEGNMVDKNAFDFTLCVREETNSISRFFVTFVSLKK